MPEYLFSYRGDPAVAAAQTPTEAREGQARFDAWVDRLGEAAIVPGTPVKDCRTVSSRSTADTGPACVLGYSIIRADNMQAALDLARACPHLEWGDIEVAETMPKCSSQPSSPEVA